MTKLKAKELQALIEERIIPELERIKQETLDTNTHNDIHWLIDNTKGAM